MAVEFAEAARPYAEAAHKHAAGAGGDAPGKWQEMLDSLVGVVADDGVQTMLSDPRVSPAKAREGLMAVLEPAVRGAGDEADRFANFVHQLHEHERLDAAGEIARMYGELRRAAEGELEIEVRTAFELDEETVGRIADRMKEKFGAKSVTTTVTVDPDLGGGALVIAGDDVIDGSVRSELESMRVSLRRQR